MKRYGIAGLCMTACVAFGTVITPVGQLEVQAQEVVATVEGTVLAGTTSELLLLSTREGKMEIKLDSGTDTNECKILLPGKKIRVSVAYGSDEYLHAVKLMGDAQQTAVSVDSSASATVTGTLQEKTNSDILYVKTPQGEMEIKWDATTDMSGCTVLVVNKNYSITCARGSDAYMHALSISDSSQTGSFSSADMSLTPAPEKAVNVATVSTVGTVTKDTKEGLLYLSTSGGEMQIAIDANTDSRNGMVLTPGRSLVVSFYHGSDEYLHAATITGVKDYPLAVEIDTSSPSTVTGTVGSKSTENILYLNTPQGAMELKLDAVRSVKGCKVLVEGKKVSVSCARGADAYMHALDIVGM